MRLDRRHFTKMAMTTAVTTMPGVVGAEEQERKNTLAGQVVFQYVGRASLNLIEGAGVIYGYLSTLTGIQSSALLFEGVPGENTALLTFRADITFQAIVGNGDLGNNSFAVTPILIAPGPFHIYFARGANHDWTNPDTFSIGQRIATFQREWEQMALSGPITVNAASAQLRSSESFRLHEREKLSFRDLAPNGLTNITTGSTIPLAGSTPVSPVFAFAGYALSTGR
jgi:hypothetical protein